MSYRAFKKLFGETSLERKCRIWLGVGILSMMSVSFYIFARRTENLATEQTVNSVRVLVSSVVATLHLDETQKRAFAEDQGNREKTWPPALRDYRQALIVPNTNLPKYAIENPDDVGALISFANTP